MINDQKILIQPYISSHVKDIHDVLEITVYDEDKDHKYEFLGKGWLISESILISVADFQLCIYKPNDCSTTLKILSAIPITNRYAQKKFQMVEKIK